MALDKDVTTVHYLRYGIAICGRPGLPFEWPIGHDWVGFDKEPTAEQKKKLCVQCKAAKKRAEQDKVSAR